MADRPDCRIVRYDDAYSQDFRRLNEEWLERYFEIEPIDALVLSKPRELIIDKGGEIFFAVLDDGRVVGTCALKPAGVDGMELTKMAVTSNVQGGGIGRKLLSAVLEFWRNQQGGRLFLESHSSLGAALKLYEAAGFRHTERPRPSEYDRADVYMVWQPNARA
ncbi:MAG: GNAT family N-acetyltransferase [Pseudomonadota bacterium]